uniref:Uncharacterized protein n=1 Tax=Amphimedon queenslandica TaxID=400682 RepID=A0A1X7VKD9_AMPQE
MLAAFRQQHNDDEEVKLICDMDENESDVDDQDEDAVDISRLQDELDNFQEREQSHRVAFVFFRRTSCFCHTLQLVNEFNKLKPRKALLKSPQTGFQSQQITQSNCNAYCKGRKKINCRLLNSLEFHLPSA